MQDEHNIYAIMKNVPYRLSPQWLCGNSCSWAHDVRLHIAGTNEPKSAQQAKQGVHKAIVVITKKAHCFHDCIYIYI